MHLGCIIIPAWNTWSCRSGHILWGDMGQAGLLGLGYLRHGHSGPLARPGPGDSSWWRFLPQQSVLCSLKLSQVLFYVVFLPFGQCLFFPITVISLQLCPALGLFSPGRILVGLFLCAPALEQLCWHCPGVCPCPWHSRDTPLCVRSTWRHHYVPEQNDPLRNPQNEGFETPAQTCLVACQWSKA